MKIDNKTLLALTLLAFTLSLVHGQGTLLIQHSGSTDPTSEGFILNNSYGNLTAPVTGDLGMNAWTTKTTNSGPLDYSQTLTPQQQLVVSGADWSLSTTVRFVSSGTSAGVEFVAGSEGGFFLMFGTNSYGDPTVKTSSSGSAYVLTGVGSTYNNYQLVYSAASATASLWVNGTDVVNGITGNPNYSSSSWSVYWGEFQGGPAQANWNLLSLETVPEPSSWALLLLGGGLLAFRRR